MTRLSAVLRRMLAPASRARLFIMIAVLLAAAFGALSWRGIRDERTRVAYRTCFYALDAARLLEAKARLRLEALAQTGRLHGTLASTTDSTRLASAMRKVGAHPVGTVAVRIARDTIVIVTPSHGLIVTPVAFIQQVIAPVFDSEPVFSSLLAGRTPNRSVANLGVMDEHWAMLYQTGPMSDTVQSHFTNQGSDDNYRSPGCVGMSPDDPAMAGLALLACMTAAILFARREAELARLRSDFVSNVSHELRMPLAQILLSGETLRLRRTRSPAEHDREVESIVREAHRLVGFVENVLSFSRIEHENVQMAPRPIDLHRVVEATIATAHTLADARAATITSTVPCDLDAFVDPDGFRQVLYNLLENAIKYGPVGQRILVNAAPSATIADRIEIGVDDEGPGIPSDATAEIFEPFVRLERDRHAGIAGSGLGLSVVHFIVKQHGGRVRVEPGSRGRGSRFVIDIPW